MLSSPAVLMILLSFMIFPVMRHGVNEKMVITITTFLMTILVSPVVILVSFLFIGVWFKFFV